MAQLSEVYSPEGLGGPFSGNLSSAAQANPTCTPKELKGSVVNTEGGNSSGPRQKLWEAELERESRSPSGPLK